MSAKNILKQLLREKVSNAQLCAKWQKRKGEQAAELRKFLGWSPKHYRKTLVRLTKVVETQMCAKKWDDINFNQVPSVASARYKKAFDRNTSKYSEWTSKLAAGDKSVKVNASAVYPYDVLKGVIGLYTNYSASNLAHITAQWEALPNYVGDANILPIVDTSGSMTWTQVTPGLQPLHIGVSLALYLADKNRGAFNGLVAAFSDSSEIRHLSGNILDKVRQTVNLPVGGSTNLHSAFENILKIAKDNNVPQSDMPKVVLIFSDMQFNSCSRYDDSAIQMIERKYREAGYEIPNVVFWNLNAHDNVPVKFDKKGVALVSGFSPAIVQNVLCGDLEKFTPEAIMLKAIMNPRYDLEDIA